MQRFSRITIRTKRNSEAIAFLRKTGHCDTKQNKHFLLMMQTPFDESTTDAAQALELWLAEINNYQKLETISVIAFSILASVSLDYALVDLGAYGIPPDAFEAIELHVGNSEERKLQVLKALASQLTLPLSEKDQMNNQTDATTK